MDNTPYINLNINKLNESFSLGEVCDDLFSQIDEIRCIQGLYSNEIARLLGPTLRLRHIDLDPSLSAVATSEDLSSLISNGASKPIITKIIEKASELYTVDRVDKVEAFLLGMANKRNTEYWSDCILVNAVVINNGQVAIDNPRCSMVVYRLTRPDLDFMFSERSKSSEEPDAFMISGIHAYDLVPKSRIGEAGSTTAEQDTSFMNPTHSYTASGALVGHLMKHPAVFSNEASFLGEEALGFVLNKGLIDLEAFVKLANNLTISNTIGIYYDTSNVKRLSREDTSLLLKTDENNLNQHIMAIENNVSNMSTDDIDSSGDMSNSIQGLEL